MRRALLFCAAISVALACGDNITEPVPDRSWATPKILFATSSTDDGLSISTDKDDYAPGDTVHLTGAGWPADDVLEIRLDDEPATHDPHTWTTTVGADGTFHDSTYVVDIGDLGVTFTLTATSQSTGRSLTVIFTDANSAITAFSITPTPVSPGGTLTWSADAKCTGPSSGANSCSNHGSSVNGPVPNGYTIELLRANGVCGTSGQAFSVVASATTTGGTAGGTVAASTTPGSYAYRTAHPTQTIGGNNWSSVGQGTTPCVTVVVTVANQAPTVDAGGPYAGSEGTAINFGSGDNQPSVSDADNDALLYKWTYTKGADVDAAATCSFSNDAILKPIFTCTDNGTYTVKLEVDDQKNPKVSDEATVNVSNAAPTATALNTNSPVSEGSNITLSLASPTDPSSVDATSLHFAFDCGNGYGAAISYATAGTTNSFTCSTADNETRTVKGKVFDKDGGSNEYTAQVQVNNEAPTVNAGADQSGKEGETISLSGSFSDPGTGDTHEWTWAYIEGFNAGATCTITGATSSMTPTITCNDDGKVKVTLTVRDDDGGVGADDMELTLTNVAPTATALNTNSPVNEGSNITLSLAGVTDPSSIDLASLHYAYDCGSGYSAADYATAGATNSASCPTDDNGTRAVKGKVFDKDGGSNEYTANVTIVNVPPTAVFNAPSPVNEGTAIALSLTNADDVSSVDKAAGFTYAFDCGDGAGYSAFGSTASRSCPTTDNGTRNVKGKIQDKDGGVSEYTSSVQVVNVPPTNVSLTNPDGSPLPSSVIVAGTLGIKVTFEDPGTGDTHTAQIDCDNGSGTVSVNGGANVSSGFETSCTYPSIGMDKTITVTITDDDQDSGVATHKLTVKYNFAGFFAPVDRPNTYNVSKAGQAIPLKWRLTDALGRPITDLTSVVVKSVNLNCVTSAPSDMLEEYAAGSSGLQNLGDGTYQFNWKTPAIYAGTCKSIALVFGAGALSYVEGPHAFFTFKK
jgi:hypothetical protein